MRRMRKLLVQLVTLIIGLPLLALGLILIPLPGPGLLVCFVALFVLSFGFDWSKKYLEQIKAAFKAIYVKAKERADKIEQSGRRD